MRARLGVTGPQRLALRIITQVPGISSSGLAEVLQLHPSTLTGVLARLEARRLIVRRVNRHDRREGLLRVTPSGRALGRQMRGSIELAVDRVLRAARPGHVAAARRLLGSLVDEIERMP
jgi:DNA-binding MarR family transcriptional regulator